MSRGLFAPRMSETRGDVILLVPRAFRVPDHALVPPSGRLLGVADARTGDLFPGVLRLTLRTGRTDLEIVVKLREIAVRDRDDPAYGYPARTPEDVARAVEDHGGAEGLPWVSNRYRVVGFEPGPVPNPELEGAYTTWEEEGEAERDR